MEVRIKNSVIQEAIEFFFNLKLDTGKESRHRTRFVRKLNEHWEDIQEQKQDLLKRHCYLDDNGEPKIIEENGEQKYHIKNMDEFAKDWNDLMNEELIIDDKNSQLTLKIIRKILDEYDGEKNGSLSGRKAVLYEYLCEVFKVDEEIEEEEE